MPTPTIPAGNLFMNATLYTGTGANATITNGVAGQSFQPDFVWLKTRNVGYGHALFDSVRGVGNGLQSNSTNAEAAWGTSTLASFNSNGFGLGADTSYLIANSSGNTFVGWQWKAGGTAVSNTSGSITSSVSANTTSGFSIVTYTGNGTAGATIGHGLGVAPVMTIIKRRSSTEAWPVWHTSFNSAQSNLRLSGTDAIDTASPGMFNNTYPTSTLITLGNGGFVNTSSQTYVCYAWSQIAGYSAFGSYTGNGSADGPFVYTGFRPKYVMFKRTDSTGSWHIFDSARNPYNLTDLNLYANGTNTDTQNNQIDLLSNGFKCRSSDTDDNASGGTVIYMAFAENPLKYANAR